MDILLKMFQLKEGTLSYFQIKFSKNSIYSFERRVNQHFNNSMVAAIYQQRPGGNNRRPKKGNSAQNYSAYA